MATVTGLLYKNSISLTMHFFQNKTNQRVDGNIQVKSCKIRLRQFLTSRF